MKRWPARKLLVLLDKERIFPRNNTSLQWATNLLVTILQVSKNTVPTLFETILALRAQTNIIYYRDKNQTNCGDKPILIKVKIKIWSVYSLREPSRERTLRKCPGVG